jgi:hypothetical protein
VVSLVALILVGLIKVLKVVLAQRLVVILAVPVLAPVVLARAVPTLVPKVGLVRLLVGLLKLSLWPKPRLEIKP